MDYFNNEEQNKQQEKISFESDKLLKDQEIHYNTTEKINFFYLLSGLPYNIPLRIPETIIYGFGFLRPTYAYSSQKGFLKFSDFDENFFGIFMEKWEFLSKINPPEAPLAVVKIKENGRKILIFSKEEGVQCFKELMEAKEQQFLIQRYICQLNRASVLRVV